MKTTAVRAIAERLQGEAPSRWRAGLTSASAGAAVAIVVYRILRQPA
jgi:hypothetical protein